MRDKILNLPGCTSSVRHRSVLEKKKFTATGAKRKSAMGDKNNETDGEKISQKRSPHMGL